jgi:hypothetical protein
LREIDDLEDVGIGMTLGKMDLQVMGWGDMDWIDLT